MLKRIWQAIIAVVCMVYILPFIGLCMVMGWIFRSRAERVVRSLLRKAEPRGRIFASCLLNSEPNAWIVGIKTIRSMGGPNRYFRVRKRSFETEELFGDERPEDALRYC